MFDTTYCRNETPQAAENEKCQTCYYKGNLEYSKQTGMMYDKTICTFCFLGDGYVSDSVDPKEYFKEYTDDFYG